MRSTIRRSGREPKVCGAPPKAVRKGVRSNLAAVNTCNRIDRTSPRRRRVAIVVISNRRNHGMTGIRVTRTKMYVSAPQEHSTPRAGRVTATQRDHPTQCKRAVRMRGSASNGHVDASGQSQCPFVCDGYPWRGEPPRRGHNQTTLHASTNMCFPTGLRGVT
jgi:hypothetical protein